MTEHGLGETYERYTLSTPLEEAAAKFAEKHGYLPDTCERVETGLIKGGMSGYVKAGPVKVTE